MKKPTWANRMCRAVCVRLCGFEPLPADGRLADPLPVREAAHRLSNEVSILHGRVKDLQRSADSLTDLVVSMQEHGKP